MEQTRVETGVVGVPPRPDQLKTPDTPETVVANFASLCNLWCSHCLYPEVTRLREKREREGHPRPVLFLPFQTMKAVADEMAQWPAPGVLRIAADGEPLLHPQAVELIAYAKARGLTVALTTNGIPLTRETSTGILATDMDVVDVSIDAATPETYAKVRRSRGRTNRYAIVEANVRALIQACETMVPRPRTRIMVNMIDQPLAHAEVPAFVDKWRDYGADAVLIRPFHSTSAQTLQEGVATPAPEEKRFPCRFPFTRLNVGFDQEGQPVVYYCSHDWAEKTVVGVLGKNGSLRDIWQGPEMNEIRRRHLANDFPADSFCRPCPDWYLGWGKSHHHLVGQLSDGSHR